VEDAKDRLAALGLPIPTPTPEQAAASLTLENSRGSYTISNRMLVFVLHRPDTVPAATKGDPPLEDAKPTYAPAIVHMAEKNVIDSVQPNAPPPAVTASATPPTGTTAEAPAVVPAPAPAPLALQDVPAAPNGAVAPAPVLSNSVASPASSGGSGIGVQIVQPTPGSPAPASTPGAPPPSFPGSAAAPDSAQPASAQPAVAAHPSSDNGGIGPVGPTNTVLAPIEKPAAAPEAINDVIPGSQPPAQTAPANGKTPKPALDKDDSSSKKKKKKGLEKLNPF
jgi:outer membrane protein assembly factor BamD